MVTRGKFTAKARRRAMRQFSVASGRGATGRGTCPVCNRDNVTINRDGRLRVHGSKVGWPPSNCAGSGRKPKEERA